ncbi:MAG: GtrA family protein, partial [Mesorhizobium sp.]
WQINRHVTFAPSSRSIAEEGARYGGVGIATSIVNYLVYCAVLLALPALPPLAALAIASIVAMTLSFLGYSRLVFDR